MRTVEDIVGRRYGRLTVIARVDERVRKRRWLTRCDCGAEKLVEATRLRSGNTRSCGCLYRKHGHTTRSCRATREYRTWSSMLQRCINPRHGAYRYYGAKGITVCDRWLKFENFIADMGPRGEGLTIDRIDGTGNYEPGNCRWATNAQQSANKSNARILEFRGNRLSITEWAKRLGIGRHILNQRLYRGWPVEKILTRRPRNRPDDE